MLASCLVMIMPPKWFIGYKYRGKLRHDGFAAAAYNFFDVATIWFARANTNERMRLYFVERARPHGCFLLIVTVEFVFYAEHSQ